MPTLILRFVICLAFSAACSAQISQSRLTEAELDAGWISLFDGETMFGWRPVVDCDWQIRDKSITVSSGPVGLLRTTTQFSDYHLKLEFRADPLTNSGIFLHTPPKPKNPSVDCYELNIAPADNPFPTGSLVGRKKYDGAKPDGKWHTFDILVERGNVTIRLDDEELYTYVDPRPLGRGFIGLQHNQGAAAFRNVKLRPIGLKPLFNGTDLSGWTEYPDMDSVFRVTDDGDLNVRNGRGQLETTETYGDFVLQLDCITHAHNLNSGIFFRCIPGDTMMGYESQIHNGFKENDRTQPIDHGTGGIFRRQSARQVVADDKTWFHKTLIAEGPHIATWVNGVQVCDWTDRRKPNENPRRGLRLEAGTIMIQGHDPTTDISFRNLNAAEMEKRNR